MQLNRAIWGISCHSSDPCMIRGDDNGASSRKSWCSLSLLPQRLEAAAGTMHRDMEATLERACHILGVGVIGVHRGERYSSS